MSQKLEEKEEESLSDSSSEESDSDNEETDSDNEETDSDNEETDSDNEETDSDNEETDSEEKDSNNNKYKVLSLFTGIGGMDLGFGENVIVHKKSISKKFKKIKSYLPDGFVLLKPTNFNIIFQNDILEGAKEIYLNNFKNTNYIVKSIVTLIEEKYIFPSTDVVIGGFPCNDFSNCGKRLGFQSNKSHDLKQQDEKNNRGTLYKSFVEVVKQTNPKIFIAENVSGLLTMKDNPIKIIVNDFSELGYDVNYSLVKSEEHGIPQKRWRVIIFGIRKLRKKQKLDKDWYKITDNKINCKLKYYLKHLKEPSESNDISQTLYSKAKKLLKGQGQVEINMESFSPTIRAEHHGNIEFRRHENGINCKEKYLQERRLTIRECSMIQTFPPNYVMTIKKNMKSYKYIGNAVPPLLSYLISQKVEFLLSKHF
jgi:DNA (cytosine-5)-methyltransferase 1